MSPIVSEPQSAVVPRVHPSLHRVSTALFPSTATGTPSLVETDAPDDEWDAAWAPEIAERIQRIKSGKEPVFDFREIMQEIKEEFHLQ
jgi:hypothetical protein